MVRRQHGPLPELIRARLLNTISFFFSNIHDDVKGTELWKVFGDCGKVKDVFIPSKRTKEGKGFGFVRFADEDNTEELLCKLDQIWLHSTKLKVNVSRFKRVLAGEKPVVAEGLVRPQYRPRTEGVSYAAATVNSPGRQVELGQSVSNTVEAEVLCEIPTGRVKELSESVIGLLLPKLCVQQIREQLIVTGMPNIHVASMGGNQVIISSPIKGFLKESLLIRRDWWLSWFSGFTRWSIELQQPGRCVWLRVTEVPIHLWCRQVLHLVGSRFGEVMDMEVTNMNFEFAMVRVLLQGALPVAAPVTLVVEGRCYMVYVREDFVWEDNSRQTLPVTVVSGVADAFSKALEGCSDEEGWAKDIGRSSSSSVGTDECHREEFSSTKCVLADKENTLDNNTLLGKTLPPRLLCQEYPLANPSFLFNSPHGEDEDSERRRKVSLDKEN